MLKINKATIFLLALFVGAGSPDYAQIVGGTIGGTVKDSSGACWAEQR